MKVALVTMPFSFINRPSLGISLLRAALLRQEVDCDIFYLQLPFATQIGVDLYYRIAQFAPRTLLGEWLFAHLLFDDLLPDAQVYVEDILFHYRNELHLDLLAQLPHLRDKTGPYIEACLESVPWDQYAVIGFSTTFAQNLSSLALAKQIKNAWPETNIVFGGANCEGEMGAELHRQFPFIDYVCSGESDRLFPDLVQRLEAERNIEDLPGLIYRRDGHTIANGTQAPPVLELDSLPFPDFDDYFAQLEHSSLELGPSDLRLMLETSRGCWWGAKSQCAFCGLNSDTMVYRSKSDARVLEEFTYLARRHPTIQTVDVVDKILDMHFFQNVIPGLIERNLGLNIFYFVKANLNKEQLRMLKQAGIQRIQPGIESLDSQILRLVGKGCNTIQNIQLLKWASELGLEVIWNFISGFPGEDAEAYQRQAQIIPSLIHLPPPTGPADRVRLDRFSPFFTRPEANGMVNIRPAAVYSYIYPFSADSLGRLAYYFDFDYADGVQPETYTNPMHEAVKQWHNPMNSGSLLSLSSDGRLTLFDTRPTASQREIVLKGVEKAIYEFCDQGQTLASILRFLQGQGDAYGSLLDSTGLHSVLDWLVDKRVMVLADDHYLSLAIPIDDQAQAFINNFVSTIEKPS